MARRAAAGTTVPLCPSAQPEMEGAFAFAVVGGAPGEPRSGYLAERVAVSPELLALAGPVKATEVFRFSAPCAGGGCMHFDGAECRLANKLVQLTPPAARTLPACQVRPDCRWWRQEGKAACLRCPGVVTEMYEYSEAQAAADPRI